MLGMLVEGGAATEVDRARVVRTARLFEPAHIHALAWPSPFLSHPDVRCREADRSTPVVAVDHLSLDRIGSAEHAGSVGHLTAPEGSANRRGRYRLKIGERFLDRINADYFDFRTHRT